MSEDPAILPVILSAATLVLLAAGAIALVLYRYRRQRPYSVAISDVSMPEAWEAWVRGDALPPAERSLRDALLAELDEEAVQAVKRDLLELEKRVLGGRYPLTAIRKELMASVDRRMLNTEILRLPEKVRRDLRAQSPDVIQSDEQARRYIAANELRLHVLREYAARRYGDKAPHDWFSVYERASRMKQRNARAWIEHSLTGVSAPGENERQQAITIVDGQLKMRLLQVPPGTEFPEVHEPPDGRTLH